MKPKAKKPSAETQKAIEEARKAGATEAEIAAAVEAGADADRFPPSTRWLVPG